MKCIEYSSEIFSRWLGHKRAGAGARGVRGGEGCKRAWGHGVRCFCIPTTSEFKKFKWIWLQQVDFECPNHFWVSPPLNLQSKNDKIAFIDPATSQNFGAKSRKQSLRWLSEPPRYRSTAFSIRWRGRYNNRSTYSPTPTLIIDFASLTLVPNVNSVKHSANFTYLSGSNCLL